MIKYVLENDYCAETGKGFEYFNLTSDSILNAMQEAGNILYKQEKEKIYCSTIYEAVKGKRGKEFSPILRSYSGESKFYANGCNWNDSLKMMASGCSYTFIV